MPGNGTGGVQAGTALPAEEHESRPPPRLDESGSILPVRGRLQTFISVPVEFIWLHQSLTDE
jgi:hypothetical protein